MPLRASQSPLIPNPPRKTEASLEDAQDLRVVVQRRYVDFEGRSDLNTWLFGIAVNVERNRRRMEGRRGQLAVSPVERHRQGSTVRTRCTAHENYGALTQRQRPFGSVATLTHSDGANHSE